MDKLKFIIIDRLTRARDNGEYFYKYLKDMHPEIEIIFGLHPESKDWDRLKKEGFNLLDLTNKEAAKEAVKDCTHFLFSETNEGYKKIVKLFDRSKTIFIYLNHGCFFAKGNRCYPIKKFDYMICGNQREFDSVMYNAEKENLPKDTYWLTGLPRMDEQVRKYRATPVKNTIVIQPWWRNTITGWRIVESTNHIDPEALDKLINSDFVKGYNRLLNNRIFKKICRDNNLEVVFKRHPVMENLPGVFQVPSWIIDEPNEPFIDIFAKTKLFISDYSSNAFEVANLGVPCIYFEPDYKYLTVDCNRPEWAWNVKEDGLGPATFSVAEFLRVFKDLVNNNFVLEEKYLQRRAEQILFLNDDHNCERCFQAIVPNEESKGMVNKRGKFGEQYTYNPADYYLYF